MDNKKKNFFMPFGYFGNLWRTIIFLCGFLLLCFLYKLLPSVPPVSPIEKFAPHLATKEISAHAWLGRAAMQPVQSAKP